jgi:hypothetical protein
MPGESDERYSDEKSGVPENTVLCSTHEVKRCQKRKWLLHRCDAFFKLGGTSDIPEKDTGYAIAVFQRANDVVLIRLCAIFETCLDVVLIRVRAIIEKTCLDVDGQGWPDI